MLDFEFIRRIDKKLIELGVPLYDRPFRAVMEYCKENQIHTSILTPELHEPAKIAYCALYPTGNFSGKALQTGLVTLRNVPIKVEIPVVLGSAAIDPMSWVDVSENERRINFNEAPNDYYNAYHSSADIFDFTYGVLDLSDRNERAKVLWGKSRNALDSAVATILSSGSYEMSVQQSCLCAELAIKGTLAYLGITEEIRTHDLTKLSDKLIKLTGSKTNEHLLNLAGQFPDYVISRYYDLPNDQTKTTQLVVKAQFIAADSLRRVSERHLGKQISEDTEFTDSRFI